MRLLSIVLLIAGVSISPGESIAQQAPWGISFQVQSISPEYALQVKRRIFSTQKLEGEMQLGGGFLAQSWMLSAQGTLLYGHRPHRPGIGLLVGPWVQQQDMGVNRDWMLYVFPHFCYQFNPIESPLWIRLGSGPSWLDDPTPQQLWAPGALLKWTFFLQLGYGFGGE